MFCYIRFDERDAGVYLRCSAVIYPVSNTDRSDSKSTVKLHVRLLLIVSVSLTNFIKKCLFCLDHTMLVYYYTCCFRKKSIGNGQVQKILLV